MIVKLYPWIENKIVSKFFLILVLLIKRYLPTKIKATFQ